MGISKIIERSLLAAGLALCLLQVWLPARYLTGDGPCHLYNAQIVHDLWAGTQAAMYQHFFTLTYAPDPNWLSTFALAALLFVAKGALAEKLFLSAYVLLYVGGFSMLLRRLGAGGYLLATVFIFVFPLTLAKGFYNYSFSIAFYFWVVWAWLRFMERSSARRGLTVMLFVILIFFTHLLPFIFAGFTCAMLTLSYSLAWPQQARSPIKYLATYIGWLLAFFTPFILLMLWFTHKEGGLQLQLGWHPYRLIELMQFKYIINLVSAERIPAMVAGCTLLLLFACTVASALPRFKLHRYDGFIAALLFAGIVYCCFPEDFMGRAIIISIRVQLFVFLLMLCCIAYRLPAMWPRRLGAAVLFLCFAALSVVRMQAMSRASAALREHLAMGSKVMPGAVLLPLSFSPGGLDDKGRPIADRNAIFHHATDYLGVEQPLIIMDNYEANIGYFPVKWQAAVNPYTHLSTHQGIEGQPPSAGIAAYEARTGVRIDYISAWCYSPSFFKRSIL